jgi:rRNA-processing protein FCF1
MAIQSGGAVYLDADILRHFSSIMNSVNVLDLLQGIYDTSYKVYITENVYNEVVNMAKYRPQHARVLAWVNDGIDKAKITERPFYPQFQGEKTASNPIVSV